MGVHEAKQARARILEQRKTLLATLEGAVDSNPGDTELRGIAGLIAKGKDEWLQFATPREKKNFIAKLFSEIYFRHDEITAFRLAPALVGDSGGVWAFAAKMPVILPEPFRITPREPEVPEGMRRCSRCREIKIRSFLLQFPPSHQRQFR